MSTTIIVCPLYISIAIRYKLLNFIRVLNGRTIYFAKTKSCNSKGCRFEEIHNFDLEHDKLLA